jgi:hypothetical protein
MDTRNPYGAPAAEIPAAPRVTISPDRIRIVADHTVADHLTTVRVLTAQFQKGMPRAPQMIVTFCFGMGFVLFAEHTHQSTGLAGIDVAIALVGLFVLVQLIMRTAAKRRIAILANSPFLGMVDIDLGPDTLEISATSGHRCVVPWPLVESLLETPTLLIIRPNPLLGWWIARRDLGDQATVDAVVAFIRARNPGVTCERLDAQGRVL